MKKLLQYSKVFFNILLILCGLNKVVYANSTIETQPTYMDMETFRDYMLCYAIKNDNTLWAWEDYRENENEYNFIKVADNVKSIVSGYYITTNDELWKCDNRIINNSIKTSLIAENVSDFCDGSWMDYIVKNDNSLWAKGGNNSYGFSLSDRQFQAEDFIKISNNVKTVATGDFHTIVLKTDGSAWTLGSNQCGQLGIGSYEDSYIKNKIMDDVKSVGAGVLTSFIIKNDSSLWSMGSYEYGGVDRSNNRLIPTYYTNDVKQVSGRYGYNLVLKNSGELWLYGESENETYDNKADSFFYPQKIMENVAEITDKTIYTDTTDIALIVTNEGELFRYNVRWEHGKGTINLSKIMSDVKLPSTDKPNSNGGEGYSDLSVTDNRYYYINSLIKANIISGITDTEFMPDKAINRAETAALMLRMTGKENESGNGTFADVPQNSWYYNIAGASQKYHIFDGYEDNTFRGEETVSELQLVALAARTLRNEGTAPDVDEKAAPDLSDIPDWAKADIEYAYQYGIVTADELKTLSDKGMTRGDAAVILYRLYQVI